MPQSLSVFDPASPQAAAIRNLSFLVLSITAFIFVVVEGILIYVIVRFRQHKSVVVSEPAQVYGSKPIEIAWTAAPGIVVFILTLVTIRTLWEVKAAPPVQQPGDNALFVTVIGHQWWWEYRYETFDGRKLGFTTANELHVPVSSVGQPRPVILTLQSADVCHSFWVPRLAGKTDLIPGRINRMTFEANQLGLVARSMRICFCGLWLSRPRILTAGWLIRRNLRLKARLATRASGSFCRNRV
jgi:cytochrome c oxidase subunit 2